MVDLLGGAHLLHHGVVHDHDPVGHGQGLLLVVGDHDGGDAQLTLDVADLRPELGPHLGVQGGQGLVQQQVGGLEGDGPGQGGALLLAAGHLGGILFPVFPQPHHLQDLLAAGQTLLAAEFFLLVEAKEDVLLHRHVGEEGVGLKDDAEVALGRGQGGAVLAADANAAGGGGLQAGDDAQQGGFAAAGGTEDADELALFDLQGDVPQGGLLVKHFLNVSDL